MRSAFNKEKVLVKFSSVIVKSLQRFVSSSIDDLLELDWGDPGPELPEVGHESDGVAEDDDDADVDADARHHQVSLPDVALDTELYELN